MKKTLSVFLTFCLVFTTLMTGVVTAFAEGNVIEGTNAMIAPIKIGVND